MKDLSYELIEFLQYVEHSDSETAEKANGEFVKKFIKEFLKLKMIQVWRRNS